MDVYERLELLLQTRQYCFVTAHHAATDAARCDAELYKIIAEFLESRELRRLRGKVPQKQIANAAGVSQGAVSQLEAGVLSVSVETFLRILKVYLENSDGPVERDGQIRNAGGQEHEQGP